MEHLDGLSKREILEGQDKIYIRSLRELLLGKVATIMAEVELIDDVLGGYGETA